MPQRPSRISQLSPYWGRLVTLRRADAMMQAYWPSTYCRVVMTCEKNCQYGRAERFRRRLYIFWAHVPDRRVAASARRRHPYCVRCFGTCGAPCSRCLAPMGPVHRFRARQSRCYVITRQALPPASATEAPTRQRFRKRIEWQFSRRVSQPRRYDSALHLARKLN